ncbi:hypothetical protein KUTeg_003466 [Tegillarca granosa]|uniref:Uncharacterized protein n=1 Tax=Tegillarca granosa TaxID=220873 RepID=A0ABQ9FRN3_TEGGR|nr:hypothetical protein KUTeg_003466 [Tegillarca granosa]
MYLYIIHVCTLYNVISAVHCTFLYTLYKVVVEHCTFLYTLYKVVVVIVHVYALYNMISAVHCTFLYTLYKVVVVIVHCIHCIKL